MSGIADTIRQAFSWLILQLSSLVFWVIEKLQGWALDLLEAAGVSYDTGSRWAWVAGISDFLQEFNEIVPIVDAFAIISAGWVTKITIKAIRMILGFLLNRPL